MTLERKILLVGAGPVGIEVAAALKLSGIAYRHIEAGCPGSTISWWSPGTSIFSSPDRLAIANMPFNTYPQVKASREDYLTYLRGVVQKYNLQIDCFRRLINIRKVNKEFIADIVVSQHGVGGIEEYLGAKMSDKIQTSSFSDIVLAIGDMHLPKEIGIEGEKQSNVSHFFDEPHKYFKSTVCIVGAKNSAAEAVVRLGRMGIKVLWCCRSLDLENSKIKPWLLPDIKGLIKEKTITLYNSLDPQKIEGRKIWFKKLNANDLIELEADQFLLLTGYRQDSSLYEQLGIELKGESKTPVYNPETMETNVAGVYVAGTGVAGTQVGGAKIFIENCHDHSCKIARALGSMVELFDYKSEREEQDREQ